MSDEDKLLAILVAFIVVMLATMTVGTLAGATW